MQYVSILQAQTKQIKQQYKEQQAVAMKQNLLALLQQQQMLTMLVAQTIASSNNLDNNLSVAHINYAYLKKISKNLHAGTLYKHIWIQIIDKNLNSLYRSWSKKRGDNLSKIQNELLLVFKYKKPINSISVGLFTISLKAIVPIVKNGHFLGAVEVISHFLPIIDQLKKSGINSVVIVNKKYTSRLIKNAKHRFINNHLFIYDKAEVNAVKKLTYGNIIKTCKNRLYADIDGNITVCYKLKDIYSHTIGYFILFAKPTNSQNTAFNIVSLKWLTFGGLSLISIFLIISLSLYYSNRYQKRFYKQIIDLSSNIVIITNKEHILEANKAFYKYFGKDVSLPNICLTNFFSAKKGYLQQYINGLLWIDYILKHKNEDHKVQIKINNKIYYFLINASYVFDSEQTYSLILTDITQQETYQQKLQKLTITDALTGIKNRYYFNSAVKSEIQRAKRYKYPISLIMLDIDHFKNINDTYGHDTGDEVLTQYTKLISSMLRHNDTFCRVGGEEFMIIAPYADIQNAFVMAEKIRKSVQNFKKVVNITMSFGVVQYKDNEDIAHLLKQVDQALYKAKENGRNRVEKG